MSRSRWQGGEAWKWGSPPHRAGVAIGNIEIQLEAENFGAPTPPSTVYCLMSGIDAYYAACRERGAVILLELGARPWGTRDFRVADPSGNRLGFAEVLAP